MKTKNRAIQVQNQRRDAAAEFTAPKQPAAVRILAGVLVAALVVTGLLGVL
ncbi:hypothetical protein [Arthrobacter caoxuetaonis]|uniref:Uncharacterized protein n=1 Tax=Arthrobacter caoxuetaonis TaxID=2886935 RepID=A0A9X1MHB4_9MICC|nr:hypothetical protein [Arthrobacter caoxuetaonis]MCC3299255.1 hypothetical protein [Arthrobacter caoxuetaonis]USQ59251.1 hypothetical protein NF551_16845 [Arthrobacter caoxuetaonis]